MASDLVQRPGDPRTLTDEEKVHTNLNGFELKFTPKTVINTLLRDTEIGRSRSQENRHFAPIILDSFSFPQNFYFERILET